MKVLERVCCGRSASSITSIHSDDNRAHDGKTQGAGEWRSSDCYFFARRGWARTRRLGERRPLVSTECEPRRDVHQKPLQGDLEAGRGYSRGAQARQKRLGDACNEALEAHNVENACEVVTERHQAPFAANLVEAAHQEVARAGR